jgi:MIP family channel proteins
MTATVRALAAEALGTFFFVTLGAGAILADAASGGRGGLLAIALAHGVALSVAVSIFGAVSGGHFNPAVTLGVALARKLVWGLVLPYWVAQLVGALAAGVLLRFVFAADVAAVVHLGTPTVAVGYPPTMATLLESVLTFFLLLAVFGTAVAPAAPRIAGFGIGLTVMADILVGGPLTGAAMNPARWFGPAVASFFFDNWWVYRVGPLAGGAVGGLLYRFLFDVTPAEPPARP